MNKYFNNWETSRIIRLVIGLLSLGVGIYTKDPIFFFLCVLFLVQAIFNISPCGNGGCGTQTTQKEKKQKSFTDEIIPYNKK